MKQVSTTQEFAILDAVDEPVIILDPTGDVAHHNQGLSRLIGGSGVGNTIWEIIPPADRILVQQAIAGVEGDSLPSVSVRLIASDGSFVPVEMRARTHVNGEDQQRYIIAARPIGAEEAAEANLDELMALRDFAVNVSKVNHDVRSPLGAILGNAQLAQRALSDSAPDVKERLDRVTSMCERIEEILQVLTDAKRELLTAAPALAPLFSRQE